VKGEQSVMETIVAASQKSRHAVAVSNSRRGLRVGGNPSKGRSEVEIEFRQPTFTADLEREVQQLCRTCCDSRKTLRPSANVRPISWVGPPASFASHSDWFVNDFLHLMRKIWTIRSTSTSDTPSNHLPHEDSPPNRQ
jgi:hypothetical protein